MPFFPHKPPSWAEKQEGQLGLAASHPTLGTCSAASILVLTGKGSYFQGQIGEKKPIISRDGFKRISSKLSETLLGGACGTSPGCKIGKEAKGERSLR